jgi:limonene-1,2-epoxide hydrolase
MGGKEISLPICGVFEIRHGRIKSWRDYFDMTRLTGS